MPLIILGILVVIIGLYFIGTYNSFQTLNTRIQAAYQEIGNQLKRQANLIPNLVEASKGYLSHEKGIYDSLTKARESILSAVKDSSKVSEASDALNKVLPQMTALFESNPEIKADNVIAKLMDELRDTSDKLLYSRRTLIDLTADYNAKRLVFPSNIIANMFDFKAQVGLDTPTTGAHVVVSEAETKDVEVKL